MSDWISVKDRLPETKREFPAVCPKGLIYLAHYDGEIEGEWATDNGEYLKVTHWFDLPEPPKDQP